MLGPPFGRRMKRVFTLLLLLAAATSALGGVTYKVQSSTTGLRNTTIAGTVAVDGQRMRMDVATGDNLLFKDNSIVLSSDGGKTMSVFDPATKTYYEMQLDQMIGAAMAGLRSNPMFNVAFENPTVAVRDEGDGEPIEGYRTHKSALDASYDIAIDAMGQKITSHLDMRTESWTTDQLSGEFANFLQQRGIHTGIPEIDKLIDAQRGAVKGFPLKQISNIKVNQGGNDTTMTTTATVSNIEKKNIAASQFVMPTGYTKVDDPVSKMMKAFAK
jgi:Domain of unknown function (DUF4412)